MSVTLHVKMSGFSDLPWSPDSVEAEPPKGMRKSEWGAKRLLDDYLRVYDRSTRIDRNRPVGPNHASGSSDGCGPVKKMFERLWRPYASAISYHPNKIIIYGAAIRVEKRDIEALHYRALLLSQSPDITDLDGRPIHMGLVGVYITQDLRILAEARGIQVAAYQPPWTRGILKNGSPISAAASPDE